MSPDAVEITIVQNETVLHEFVGASARFCVTLHTPSRVGAIVKPKGMGNHAPAVAPSDGAAHGERARSRKAFPSR